MVCLKEYYIVHSFLPTCSATLRGRCFKLRNVSESDCTTLRSNVNHALVFGRSAKNPNARHIFISTNIYPMEAIEKMLETRRWAKDCLRINITEPDKVIQRGKVKISLLQSEVLPKREVALREAIRAIAPEWWNDETQVWEIKMFSARSI